MNECKMHMRCCQISAALLMNGWMDGWMHGLLSVLKKRNAIKVNHEVISAALLINGWMDGWMYV